MLTDCHEYSDWTVKTVPSVVLDTGVWAPVGAVGVVHELVVTTPSVCGGVLLERISSQESAI